MANLPIDTGVNAMSMANAIFGEGVTVVAASYSGDDRSSGIYSNGEQQSPGVTPGDTGAILSTGRLRDFTNANGQSNQSNSTSSNTRGVDNDSDFNTLAGTNTYDAAILEVDFIPEGDTMSMQFVFSSEEYPEYAGSLFNDVVGVWVNGQPVEMTVGTGDTNVNSLNDSNNENLYVSNANDAFNTEMDGFTVTLTLKMAVVPGEVNSIKIGIADVGDTAYDSALLIAGNSVQTALIANDDFVTIGTDYTKTVDVLANDEGPGTSELVITHINGQEVVAGDSITLATGQQVTLNANGTLTITSDADTEDVNFSYTVAAGGGNGISDTAFVTINSVPCFVAGTLIATQRGDVRVETLKPGDLVHTLDDGLQPLRWVGRREVQAVGHMAPIRFAAGSFGNRRDILLSPQHRVLVENGLAELLFGEGEVLIAAKELVNDGTVQVCEGGTVEYVHILFDKHQIVFAEGMEAESFLPGAQTTKSFEQEIVAEICEIFPELDPVTGAGYSPAARRTLRSYEAQLLVQAALAA